MNINKHIELLGLKVEDKVTGITGIVTSVSFDLYGCIQAIINRGLDNDGKSFEQMWFDVARLRVIDPAPVMDRPNYEYGLVADGKKGPAEKPAISKP